jgi:uncharacterized cupin superfamily protein
VEVTGEGGRGREINSGDRLKFPQTVRGHCITNVWLVPGGNLMVVIMSLFA